MKKIWMRYSIMLFIIVFVILIRGWITGIPDIAVITVPSHMNIDNYEFLFQGISRYFYYGEGIMKVSERNKLAGIYAVDDNYFKMNHIKMNYWTDSNKKEEKRIHCLISTQAAIRLFGKITPSPSDIMIGDTAMKVAGTYEIPFGGSNLVHEETVFVLGDITGSFQLKQKAYIGQVNKKTQNLIAPTIESMIHGAAVNQIYQQKHILLFWIDLLLIVYGLCIIVIFFRTFFQRFIKKSYIPLLRTIGVTALIFGGFYFLISRGAYIDGRIVPERFFSMKDWIKKYDYYLIEQRTLFDIPYFWNYTVKNIEQFIKLIYIPLIMMSVIIKNGIQEK